MLGEVVPPNVENQDFVIFRSDGVPLYNFGAVVDDVTMEISLVARGRDHMINTPPQISIRSQIMPSEALGAMVPEFAHLPMMLAQSDPRARVALPLGIHGSNVGVTNTLESELPPQ